MFLTLIVIPTAGFKPTYEELKPVRPTVAFVPVYGFKPTYEELKLALGGVNDPDYEVLSLPMRN